MREVLVASAELGFAKSVQHLGIGEFSQARSEARSAMECIDSLNEIDEAEKTLKRVLLRVQARS